MIWATVSSKSCFGWQWRASPSSAAKNIINQISVLTTWWCLHVELSLVLLEKGVCYDQYVLLTKLLDLALLHFVFQGQTCLLLQVFLDFLLLHSNPLRWNGHFLVLVVEDLVGLQEPCNFSFFSISSWVIDLDYCDIEWFALETNQDHALFLRQHQVQFSSVQLLSHVQLFATPWTATHQASLSTPRVYSNSCPLSQWCHPTISSSVIPFSSRLQSFPASGSFQMSQLFSSDGQSIGVSASKSVLPMDTQDWSPLGWTGWISLQSKGLSTRVFSNTIVQKHRFFSTQLSL